jgi:nicotinate-nucleotide pyrophosphorylase (carboxylating)
MNFAHLLPHGFEDEVISWLRDDCPSFDIGGFVVGEKEEIAYLFCKEDDVVLAGRPFADAILRHLKLDVTWNFEDGDEVSFSSNSSRTGKKVLIAEVRGKARSILLGERTILNIISRASGIATAARRAHKIKESAGWHGFVAGTRKTTPGFRNVEKYALIVGGIATHRLDLSQMVMLKDNHIWSAGSITEAVKRARLAAGFSSKVEVRKASCLLCTHFHILLS